ncbi:MAG: ABC transporter substrate-binding protein [Gammaproteobacteria bacterium]|nr:ABC transporter substrate-binding protein [Gammaproteobacteria bacterium]
MAKRLFRSSIFSMFTLLLCACVQQPDEPMRIASNDWLGYKPLYLAEKLELFKSSDIHLTELSSNSEVIRLFQNGLIDGAALTLDEALLLKQDEPDVVIVLVMDISNGGDAIIAHDEIADMQALRGKRVGLEKTALGAYMLTRALTLSNLDTNDISNISYEYSEHEEAFVNRKVDAIVTFEPTTSHLLKKGGHIIFDSRQIANEIIDVFVVRRTYMEKHLDKISQLIYTWFDAINILETDRNRSIEALANISNLSIEQLITSLRGIHYPDYPENLRLFEQGKDTLHENATRLYKIMIESELLCREVNIDDLFYDRPLLELPNKDLLSSSNISE